MIKSTPTRSRKASTIDALTRQVMRLTVALEDAIVQMRKDDLLLGRRSTDVLTDAERALDRRNST